MSVDASRFSRPLRPRANHFMYLNLSQDSVAFAGDDDTGGRVCGMCEWLFLSM